MDIAQEDPAVQLATELGLRPCTLQEQCPGYMGASAAPKGSPAWLSESPIYLTGEIVEADEAYLVDEADMANMLDEVDKADANEADEAEANDANEAVVANNAAEANNAANKVGKAANAANAARSQWCLWGQ